MQKYPIYPRKGTKPHGTKPQYEGTDNFHTKRSHGEQEIQDDSHTKSSHGGKYMQV